MILTEILKKKCIVILLSMFLALPIWTDIFEKINRLSEECQAGNKKACAKLAKIAKKDKNWNARRAAVEKITNQAVLAVIAKTDMDRDVREAAVKKLNDQAILAKIAKVDEDHFVRRAAVEKITDQSLLADIAKNDEDAAVVSTAVKNISDQIVVTDIAKSILNLPLIRLIPFCSIACTILENSDSGQNFILYIVKNSQNQKIRVLSFLHLSLKNAKSLPNFTDYLNECKLWFKPKEDISISSVERIEEDLIKIEITNKSEIMRYYLKFQIINENGQIILDDLEIPIMVTPSGHYTPSVNSLTAYFIDQYFIQDSRLKRLTKSIQLKIKFKAAIGYNFVKELINTEKISEKEK